MRSYAQVIDPADIVRVKVQSADPADMQAQVNAILAEQETLSLVGIDLAGGGDGHTFLATILLAPGAEVIGSPIASTGGLTQVRCALAGSAEALAAAQAALVVPTEPSAGGAFTTFDEIFAGSSKGTRWMGMTVYTALAVATFAGARSGMAQYTSGATALAGAAQMLAFNELKFAGGLTLPAPQTLVNVAGPSIIADVQANVTLRITGGGTATVEIVKDPLGTPTSQGIMSIVLAANVYEEISVSALVGLTPASVAPAGGAAVGVRVTLTGAGELLAAQLKAAQV